MKNEKIIIVGPSGCGKDFLLKGLIEKGERYEPKITTRPMREGEINGIDYNFVTEEDFNKMYEKDLIKAHQHFRIKNKDWFYAITKENFNNNNLFIMTPHELSFISPEERKGCFVVFIDIPEDIRKQRILERNDNSDSVDRRIFADRIDFRYFGDYDMKVCDPNFDINMVYDFAF
jgi:guanylate kinase